MAKRRTGQKDEADASMPAPATLANRVEEVMVPSPVVNDEGTLNAAAAVDDPWPASRETPESPDYPPDANIPSIEFGHALERLGVPPRRVEQSLNDWFLENIEAIDALRREHKTSYDNVAHQLRWRCNVRDSDGYPLAVQRLRQLCSDARRQIELEIDRAESRARNAETIRLSVSRDLEPALRLIAPELPASAAATIAIERTAALVARERDAAPTDETTEALVSLLEHQRDIATTLGEVGTTLSAIVEELQKKPEGPSPLEQKIDDLAKILGTSIGALAERMEKLDGAQRATNNHLNQMKEAMLGLSSAVDKATGSE